MLLSPESVAYEIAHAHPRSALRRLVAEEDGEIIGTAEVGIAYDSPEPGRGFINVYVHPERTRRGAGSLLARTAEEHLSAHGATGIYAWVLDDPANRAFAEGFGYTASRSAHFLRLDLAHGTLPPLATPPPDVEIRPGSDFADDPRPVFELDAETMADEPSDIGVEFTDYADWLEETWQHPLFSPELTSVVLVDGRPVAFSAARTDDGSLPRPRTRSGGGPPSARS